MSNPHRGGHSGHGGETHVYPRFRTDLRVVRGAANKGGAQTVQVIDLDNGKQFSFSEEEYFLCQAANGTNALPTVAKLYRERFGRAIELRELSSFYRRLKILGLLDADGLAQSGPAPVDRFDIPGAGELDEDVASAGFPGAGENGARLLQALAARNPELARRMGQGNPGKGFGRAGFGLGGPGMGRPEGAAPKAPPMSFGLFDPTGLFRVLYVLFFPLKYLHWLIWPGLLFAGASIFHNWADLGADIARLIESFSTVTTMIASLWTVNFASRLVQGIVIGRFGGTVRYFGISVVFGLVPRFAVDRSSIRHLDRRGQSWAYAAPMIVRLGAFVLGTAGWLILRPTGDWTADFALLVAQLGAFEFLVTAMPLIPSDGQGWLEIQLGEHKLGPRALGKVKSWLGGRAAPEDEQPGAGWVLLYGFSILLALGALALWCLIEYGVALERRFQGPGMLMFLVLFASFVVWVSLVALRAKAMERTRPMAAMGAGGGAELGVAEPAANVVGFGSVELLHQDAHMPAELRGRANEAPHVDRTHSAARLFWALLLLGVLSVAFLPYRYDTGGEFTVLPNNLTSVSARSSGEVTEIYVNTGDWVNEGQQIAQLSSWDEQYNVAVTRAELQKVQAHLQELMDGPKPEQIALAARQVDQAQAQIDFARSELDRAQTLYESSVTSVAALQEVQSIYQQNLANLAVAQANYDLVKSTATQAQIDSAQAEVDRLTHELAFREDELERTVVRAPTSGRIITPDVKLMMGMYLTEGAEFVKLEDTQTVQIVIEVPESDIGQVELGSSVRVKPWSYDESIITGHVASIAPVMTEKDFGYVVAVTADVPNEDGVLKSSMSGYAKIRGEEMRVWQAYLRLFVNFARIEVWSWVP